MNEQWRSVIGFEGLYEVSDLGRVRRIGKAAKSGNGHGGGAVVGRILKGQLTRFGYIQVFLWKDGEQYPRQVHRLVAEAFIGPREQGYEPNHKDCNKTNNVPDNLEWVTRSDNMRHAYANGLRNRHPAVPRGEAHHRAKLSDAQVADIRARFKRGKGPSLAREFGVGHHTIYQIVKGNARKAG